jgi:propionyl-CoA carboxylase beta chain
MCPASCPAPDQEHNGIIRHGAKLLYAYCEATVPKLTVITRKAYGGAYDVMSQQAHPRRPEPGLAVCRDRRDGAGRRGQHHLPQGNGKGRDPVKRKAELVAEYREKFANPYVAAERGYIDDVIEPRETRRA